MTDLLHLISDISPHTSLPVRPILRLEDGGRLMDYDAVPYTFRYLDAILLFSKTNTCHRFRHHCGTNKYEQNSQMTLSILISTLIFSVLVVWAPSVVSVLLFESFFRLNYLPYSFLRWFGWSWHPRWGNLPFINLLFLLHKMLLILSSHTFFLALLLLIPYLFHLHSFGMK